MSEIRRASDVIPRLTLADEVAAKLVEQITAGEYRVGDRLPSEQKLAEQWDVGRSSMREAVRTLQAAGYLRSTQGSGVFVVSTRAQTIAPVDQSLVGGYTMGDLFEARVAIEGKAAELAAKRGSEADRDALTAIIESGADRAISFEAFVRLDARFHRRVAEASGNPLLLHMWDSLAPQFEEYSFRVVGLPGRRRRAHEDHRGIADAVIAGDAESASRRAEEHVMTVQWEVGAGDRTRGS
ncbi:FadR/GntR family transcriptional regulator [Microbacterium sp.]|jgi:GntR family transcriptional repressor for pyruvate dehydrogenase complex|uniref:FadR/GntR family transcriptional regulator n=1 Tax=Microbacterium sp. TaxID=51671 RepID=UPI0037CA011D